MQKAQAGSYVYKNYQTIEQRVYLPRSAKDWCTQLLLELQRRVHGKNINPCEPNTYVAHDSWVEHLQPSWHVDDTSCVEQTIY